MHALIAFILLVFQLLRFLSTVRSLWWIYQKLLWLRNKWILLKGRLKKDGGRPTRRDNSLPNHLL